MLRNVVVALLAWVMLAAGFVAVPRSGCQSVLGVRLSQQITFQSRSCPPCWDGKGLQAMERQRF